MYASNETVKGNEMVLKGETIARGAASTCPDCGTKLELKVFHTCMYYVGTWCKCGPYSRETVYFETLDEAETALKLKRGLR